MSKMEYFLLHQHYDTLGNWITSSVVSYKELQNLEMTESSSTPLIPPIVAINSDGGPDHNLCHGSVQLALICLFLKLKLDMLIAI